MNATSIERRLERMGLLGDCKRACDAYGVTLAEIKGRARTIHIARARHDVWAALKGAGWSTQAIADEWGVHRTAVGKALAERQKRNA